MKGSISQNRKGFRDVINRWFLNSYGGESRNRFFKTEELFPGGNEFDDRFEEIQQEVDALMAKRSLTKYGDIDPNRAAEVSTDWRLYYVYFLHHENKQAARECPVILDIVKRIPGAMSATIAVLEPGVELAAHKGPFGGMLRYHLGLRVPKNNPPYLVVDGQKYVWKEGESILFDDTFEHEVVNKSDGTRVILLVDFLRPMNWFYNLVNRFSFWINWRWSKLFIERVNNIKETA